MLFEVKLFISGLSLLESRSSIGWRRKKTLRFQLSALGMAELSYKLYRCMIPIYLNQIVREKKIRILCCIKVCVV